MSYFNSKYNYKPSINNLDNTSDIKIPYINNNYQGISTSIVTKIIDENL